MAMTDEPPSTKTSVPIVPQKPPVMQVRMPRLLVSRPSKGSWIVGVLLLFGLITGIVVLGADPDPSNYLAAASFNYSTIPVHRVNCVSIRTQGPVRDLTVDGKNYEGAGIPDAIAEILSIKTVLFDTDYATCPWSLGVGVLLKGDRAIHYNGLTARSQISVGICERTPDGDVNPNKCLSKNIYVFTPRVPIHDLFVIGLVGLARQQTSKLEAFQVKKPR